MAFPITNSNVEQNEQTVNGILALVRSFNLKSINEVLTEDEILGYGSNSYCE